MQARHGDQEMIFQAGYGFFGCLTHSYNMKPLLIKNKLKTKNSLHMSDHAATNCGNQFFTNGSILRAINFLYAGWAGDINLGEVVTNNI